MDKLEPHIDRECLARAKQFIEMGERPERTKSRPRLRPRSADSYRAAWRNAGSRANMPTDARHISPCGRVYPYNSVKRGWPAPIKDSALRSTYSLR